MKKRKLVLALMLSLMMLVSMIPVTSFAAGDDSAGSSAATSGNCGAEGHESDVTWSFDENTGTLTISGRGAMADYASGTSVPWNAEKAKIKAVKIENGVERIGNRAFMGCSKVTEIDIPDSVTAYGTNSFHSCTSLKSLSIGKNVEEIGQIGIYLDTAMTEIAIDSGNKNYASIDNWIYKINSDNSAYLWQVPAGVVKDSKSLEVPASITWNGTTYNVTGIGSVDRDGYVLSGAKNLTKISYGSNIKEIGVSAFAECAELESIDLKGVTALGSSAFNGCKKLNNISLNENVSQLPNAVFQNCSSLSAIVIPQETTRIGRYAFAGTALTEVNIPEKVTMVEDFAFNGCKSLEKVTGGKSLESLKSEKQNQGYVFGACTALKTVELEGTSSLVIPANTFGQKQTDAAAIEEFKLENGSFASGFAFHSNTVKTLYLGDGVETVPASFCSGQTNLTDVELTGAVTIGSNAFNGCSSLANVHFGTKLQTIGVSAFSKTGVKTVVIPDSVTEIGKTAFGSCDSIATVRIKSDSVTFDSAVLNADKALVAVDLSTIENLTLSGNDPIAINRSGAKVAACYVRGDEQKDAMKNQFTGGTVYFGVVNGGTFPNSAEFVENTLATPIKSGYIFAGWYNNADCVGDEVTTPKAGGTYYAKWIPKKATTITVNTIPAKTYDGNPIALTADNCTVVGSKGDITFSYQKKNGDDWTKLDTAPTNAGTYRVKAAVAEDDTYAGAESGYVEFEIQKADPAYSVPQNLTATEGQTLGDVALPEGFAWDADETTSVGAPGTHKFTVTYTSADTENYNVVEGIEVTLTVYMKWTALNQVPVISAEDKTLTVGDSFNPMDGVTASDAEDGNLTDKIEIAENTVDTSKAGLYSVTYKVSDKDGATMQKSINVTVKEKAVPPTTVEQGDSTNGTKTGDQTPIGMLAVLMLAAAAGITFCGRKLYKSR